MEILPKLKSAAVEIDGTLYEASHHKEALLVAEEAGEDTSQIDKEEDGMFTTTDKRLITRDEAEDEFGIRHSEEVKPLQLFNARKKQLFIIVTQDWSGLGWGKLCRDAGYPTLMAYKMKEDEDKVEEFNCVSDGIIPKMKLDEVMNKLDRLKDAIFIWDGNHNFKEAELLLKKGFKVLGGRELSYKLEHDRKYGTEIAKKAGMKVPPTFEFKTKEEGMKHLDENTQLAYVFKPDEGAGCYTTYVPDARKADKANRELYDYLESQDGDTGTYILQERKDGLEINCELFLYQGKPFFAHSNFECKRKENKDEGELVGCAQDIEFFIPLDCKLVKNTVARLLRLPEFKDYTGMVDMNVIVSDHEFYFLEYCCRQGYNSSPNLFINLLLKPFPEMLMDWLSGKIDKFYDNFRYGFGASITLRIDHPKKGLPIYIPDDLKFYFFEQYSKDNKFYLSGYGNEVGIILAHGYTIQTAAEQALRDVDRVNFPMHGCRTDLDKRDYEMSPILRYEASEAMGLFKP